MNSLINTIAFVFNNTCLLILCDIDIYAINIFNFVDIESFLLFTTRSDVRRITLGTPDQSDVVIPLSNTIHTMAVDFDSKTDTIYWSDSGTNFISRAKWDGSQEQVQSV